MAFCFAWRELKIDEICLIGMNQGDSKMLIPMNEDSEAFSLFYKKILNPDLNEWTYLNPSAQLWREAFFNFSKNISYAFKCNQSSNLMFLIPFPNKEPPSVQLMTSILFGINSKKSKKA